MLIVDESQYRGGDGPCLQAMHTDTGVQMHIDQIQLRGPELAAIAAVSVFCGSRLCRCTPRDKLLGVLNLYCAATDAPAADPDLLTVLAEFADRGFPDY